MSSCESFSRYLKVYVHSACFHMRDMLRQELGFAGVNVIEYPLNSQTISSVLRGGNVENLSKSSQEPLFTSNSLNLSIQGSRFSLFDSE